MAERAASFFNAEMKHARVTYEGMAERLKKHGLSETRDHNATPSDSGQNRTQPRRRAIPLPIGKIFPIRGRGGMANNRDRIGPTAAGAAVVVLSALMLAVVAAEAAKLEGRTPRVRTRVIATTPMQ